MSCAVFFIQLFEKSTEKHLCWILFLTKLQDRGLQLCQKEISAQIFACGIAKFLRKFFNFLRSTPSGCFCLFLNLASIFGSFINYVIKKKKKNWYTSIFHFYVKEMRLIKNTGLGPYSTC